MKSRNERTTGKRTSLLTGASVLAAAAMAAAPAMAQEATSSDQEEAIIVTGTRLVRQDFEAISPVTTVGAEQLELTATMTTDTLLNELPQIIPGNSRTSNNAGGFDFATVDLRGLGPGRTLVLLNGERLPVSSTGGAVDINTIPASLISRVEVVTGGASAVYGSDAMSGVINFVLKDDYEGGEINMTYGSEMETGNAQEFEVNGLVGGNFANGRGNITLYASYYDRNKVLDNEYDYARVSGARCRDAAGHRFVCDLAAEGAAAINAGGAVVTSGGSGTPAWGWITNDLTNNFDAAALIANPLTSAQFASYDHDCNPATPNIAYGTNPTAADNFNLSFNDAGDLEPRNVNAACGVPDRGAGSSRYNFAPDNYLIIPAERVALTTSGHYDISDDVRLNVLMNYTNSRSEVQLAPTPATGLVITLTPAMQTLISGDHPDLWAALQSRPTPLAPFTMDRRTNEVGTRNGHNESNAFFLIASLEGSLGDNWDWTLSASYGQVNFLTRAVNSVNATALRQGLSGCQDSGGNPLGVNALPGCVPLDIFGPGTLTPTMVSFISVTTYNQTIVEENRISGFVRGDLFALPAGPVSAVFGFEYRDTYAEATVDNEQRSGNIFGFNAVQDQQGAIDVYELYTEMAVPILSEMPAAHYLGLELGYRRSNYSSVGDVDTYKIGGEYAPVEWLRFRAIYNQATRAPNVFELFQNGDQGFPAYTDPCNDGDADGAPDNTDVPTAYCAVGINGVIGIPGFSGFGQNNTQVQAFAFGNPNLAPETAETYSYGIVFQPDWFPLGDLRATVDYYDIQISEVIAAFGAQFFLDHCYGAAGAPGVSDPAACARIVRNASTGQVSSVNTAVGNQGELSTKGYDIQVEWSVPIGPGQLTVNELYSIIDSYVINGSEYVGLTGIAATGAAIPDYKSVLSLNYSFGDWTVFGRWSYVPETGDVLTPVAVRVQDPAASYIDASVRWNVTDAFTLTTVVTNLTDEAPPQTITGTALQANTDPETYRVLGRSFAVSARLRF